MRLQAIVHKVPEGGYWAEVSTLPGCSTQAETPKQLCANLYEAILGCTDEDIEEVELIESD